MATRQRSVMVVDDLPEMCRYLTRVLESEGLSVTGFSSAEAALDQARDQEFDAILSDVRLPGMSGIELVGRLRDIQPSTPVILMTGYSCIDTAIEAMKSGAFHYVSKPFQPDEIVLVLERAFQRRALEAENRQLRLAAGESNAFGELVGGSAAMHEIFSTIRKVANSRATVLVTGESGTGKELVARAIHFASDRADRAFVPVNCSAISEMLLESELFGHVRGAFTGAGTASQGLFAKADRGTIFLDEIAEMKPELQSKLLRALQDGEIRPVGSPHSRVVNVRIIAATNADLREVIEDKRFRRDLYYRLNVVSIRVPPLRERREDIPLLVKFLLEKHAGGENRRFTHDAIDRLMERPWPGNVRELENVVEQAVTLAEKPDIGIDDIPEPEATAPYLASQMAAAPTLNLQSALASGLTLRELEDAYIEEALRTTGNNKLRASRLLGISERTLYRRTSGAARTLSADDPRNITR